MAINLDKERPMRLREAAVYASKLLGKPCGVAALHRWRNVGVNGVCLKSVKIGGICYTSEAAILRFIQQLSDACAKELDQTRASPVDPGAGQEAAMKLLKAV